MLTQELQAENAGLKKQLELLLAEKTAEEKQRWQNVESQLTSLQTTLQEVSKQVQSMTLAQVTDRLEQGELRLTVSQLTQLLTGPMGNPELGLVMQSKSSALRVTTLESNQLKVAEESNKDKSFFRNLLVTTGVSTLVTMGVMWLKATLKW